MIINKKEEEKKQICHLKLIIVKIKWSYPLFNNKMILNPEVLFLINLKQRENSKMQ